MRNVPGHLLKSFRQRERLMQKELASKVGMHQNNISRMENLVYLPPAFVMTMYEIYGQRWLAWIGDPFNAAYEIDGKPPETALEIPIIGEVDKPRFDFSFDTFPQQTLYFGRHPVALRLRINFPGIAEVGDYAIAVRAQRPPAGAVCIVKDEDGYTMRRIELNENLSVAAVVAGFFRRS
jgi:transcriptional regulator with XRE-family HTH domain